MTSATLSQEWRSAASGEAGNNSWLRKVSAVFLAAVLAIVGALGAPTKAFAIEGDYNETFTAYQDRNFFGEPSKFGPLFVQDYDKGMDTNGAEVVFCFNHSRAQPRDASDYNGLYPKPKYTRLASEGRLDDFLDRPSVHGQIEKHVIDVVYNYERVGQYYGLSDLDKNNIAQLAIWYFTDNKQSDVAQWGANPYAAYKTLIGQEVADGPGLKTAPDNITLDIFESTTEFSGKRYQNLLSTTTRDKTTREEVPGSEGEEDKEASITTFAHGAKKEDKSLSEQGGTITIWVSAGKKQATVPTIAAGTNYATAKLTLEAAGFTVQVSGPSDSNAVVVNTDPAGGSQVDEGSTVTITTKAGASSNTNNSSGGHTNTNGQ